MSLFFTNSACGKRKHLLSLLQHHKMEQLMRDLVESVAIFAVYIFIIGLFMGLENV